MTSHPNELAMRAADLDMEDDLRLTRLGGAAGIQPWHAFKALLREAGLRPTRPRMVLAWLLFSKGNRHVTAEMVYEDARKARIPVSLATVYNALHQFTEVGLIREIAVGGSKAFFDTNPTQHHHFLVEGEEAVLDIPDADIAVDHVPEAPDGFEVVRVDVVVRLRRKPR